MNINWQLVLNVALGLIPAISILIGILLKVRPDLKVFVAKGYRWLNIVSKVLDQIEDNFENLPYVNTVDDVVEQIIAELEQAGFKPTYKDKKEIKKLAENNFKKKEGWKLDLNNEGVKINYIQKE